MAGSSVQRRTVAQTAAETRLAVLMSMDLHHTE
jgi:hypothetical protein